MEFAEAILLTVITASTPLLLAASGELVVERAGVLNLGVEGMMIVGAACGFAGAYHDRLDRVRRAVRHPRRAGAVGRVRRADARARGQPGGVRPRADHSRRRPLGPDRRGLCRAEDRRRRAPLHPLHHRHSAARQVLFGQNAFVYFSVALVVGIWYFLYRTRAGWSCARSATITPRRMRSAIRC